MFIAVQGFAQSYHYIYTDSLIYILNATASDTLLIVKHPASITDNHVLTYDSSTNTASWEAAPGSGGGEANTISSLGGALALTAATPKSGVDLRVISALAADFNLAADVLSIDDATWLNEAELNTFAELDAQIADETIVNTNDSQTLTNKVIDDADNTLTILETSITDGTLLARVGSVETITADWVNTTNPWADNEVSNTLTSSIFIGSGSSTNAVDLATAEISGTLADGNIPDIEGLSTSLTAGSGVFSDGSNLAQDNANFFWDDTNNRLGIGTATPLEELHVVGEIFLVHTATGNDEHGLELDVDAAGFGDVKALDIAYVTGAISAGEDEAIILINIDETLATGGEVTGLEILSTGEGSATRIGVLIGASISPIHHDSGSFINPTTATDNTVSTDVPNMLDGSSGTTTSIFENDNEYILIGNVAAFQEIEIILTTPASGAGIAPTFGYSISGAHTFTTFSPIDGTNGFRNTGVISWEASDLTGHVANDNTSTFDIRITRTQNGLGTTPIIGFAKTAVTTLYEWDANANLTINSILFEGSTDDAFQHIINPIDPTADRTFNFPDDEMVAGDVLVA